LVQHSYSSKADKKDTDKGKNGGKKRVQIKSEGESGTSLGVMASRKGGGAFDPMSRDRGEKGESGSLVRRKNESGGQGYANRANIIYIFRIPLGGVHVGKGGEGIWYSHQSSGGV